MSIRDEIAQQALALPPDDRAYVAELLEQSLTTDELPAPEIATAWIAEAERRAEAYEQGELGAVNWREAMAELRAERSAAKDRH